MEYKTGWLEKWHDGRVLSIVEVQYHRVKVKKTSRKKDNKKIVSKAPNSELYFMLDKKVSLGELSLTGNSVFGVNELVEVALYINLYKASLRLLGKITDTSTFMEMNRVVFRGHIHFAAVNRDDFEKLIQLENRRKKSPYANQKLYPIRREKPVEEDERFKVTFKRV